MATETIYLTVSQLTAAASSEDWLAKYLAGENPSTFFVVGGDGVSMLSGEIHSLASHFVTWALKEHTLSKAVDNVGAVYERLQALGGEKVMNRLILNGKFEHVARFSENLDRLATHFVEVRKKFPKFNQWSDVYLGAELKFAKLKVWGDENRELFISGRLDGLRHIGGPDLVVVDYKLSNGHDPKKELIQLAIYRKLVEVRQKLKIGGELQYIWPALKTTSATSLELEQIYSDFVAPILPKFFKQISAGVKTVEKPKPVITKPVAGAKETEEEKQGDSTNKPTPEPIVDEPKPVSSDILLGAIRGSGDSLKLAPSNLARHTVVLGTTGSGKTTAGLNMLEQALVMGVPAILLDRKGDLCRYAQAAAWEDPGCPAELIETRKRLKEKLNIAVYTPGDRRGRGLRMPLTPGGLANLDAESKATIAQQSSATLADGLNYKADSPKRALLLLAFQVLTKRKPDGVLLSDLINIFAESDDELQAMRGLMASKIDNAVIQDLQTFKILNDRLQDPLVEQLDCRKFFQVKDGKVPLTIISTKFLGDDGTTSVWIAQLFLEILGFVSRNPSSKLQGLLMVDEADIYLPATRKPPTKGPMESLLKRGRSAGIGVMLLTQSPGDLDYKCRDNIRNWVMGLLTQKVALDKLSGVLSDAKTEPASLSKQKTGQFIFAAEGRATPFNSLRNCIETKQLSEDEILEVAKRSAGI